MREEGDATSTSRKKVTARASSSRGALSAESLFRKELSIGASSTRGQCVRAIAIICVKL